MKKARSPITAPGLSHCRGPRFEYGRPLAVDAEEGGPYGWRLASLDVLTRAGGGVLSNMSSSKNSAS